MAFTDDLAGAFQAELFGAATKAGIQVTARTNITPSFTVYDARDTSPSLLDILGISTHIVVQTADGKVLASYGEPVQFNPVLAVAYFAVGAMVVTALGMYASRLLR